MAPVGAGDGSPPTKIGGPIEASASRTSSGALFDALHRRRSVAPLKPVQRLPRRTRWTTSPPTKIGGPIEATGLIRSRVLILDTLHRRRSVAPLKPDWLGGWRRQEKALSTDE